MGNKKIQVWQPEYQWVVHTHAGVLLYLDAGAWQGNEKGDFRTNFILVWGHEAALCSYYRVPSWESSSNIRLLKGMYGNTSWPVFSEPQSNPILDFLKKIDSSAPLSHVQYFYKSTLKPFWEDNSMLIIIGDLHLHLLRQRDDGKQALLDNFVKVEGGKRKSLEEDFCKFLGQIYEWQNSNKDIKVKVVQDGDMLDIWEVKYVFECVRLSKDKSASARILRPFVEAGVLSSTENPKIKPAGFMKVMQKIVFPKLFTSIDKLKSLGIPFIVLRGNHDDVLGYTQEFNEGPDYLIHVEHGHRFDSSNAPGGDWLGRFLTERTVDSESMGWGDWFKGLEKPAVEKKLWLARCFDKNISLDWRDTYIKASKDVNAKERNNKLSIFIMAHTHIPYGCRIVSLKQQAGGESTIKF